MTFVALLLQVDPLLLTTNKKFRIEVVTLLTRGADMYSSIPPWMEINGHGWSATGA